MAVVVVRGKDNKNKVLLMKKYKIMVIVFYASVWFCFKLTDEILKIVKLVKGAGSDSCLMTPVFLYQSAPRFA